MVKRTISRYIRDISKKYPVVTITGPRQSGKTTLARFLYKNKPYANFENPVTREFAFEDPAGFLDQYPDGAVLDEVQRVTELFSYIQVIVDEKRKNGMFILTGSSQFTLHHEISQSLSGRTALLKLLPFSLEEIEFYNPSSLDEIIYKGFYPRIYDQDIPPFQGYSDYFQTYIERDLRQLVNLKNLSLFQKFVKLCAGRVGQILNMSSIANEVAVSQNTIREWVSLLEAGYIIFLLKPFYKNIKKRLVKSPKIYFYDIGLAAWLCGIENIRHIFNHPLRGNLYENMIVAEILKHRFNTGKSNNLSFYRDSIGNEVDLIYTINGSPVPIEIKSGKTITAEYFKGLASFTEVVGTPPYGSIVVYSGETEQKRKNTRVINHKSISSVLRNLDKR